MNKSKMMTSKADTYMFPVAPPFDMAYRKENVTYPVGPHTHNAAEIYFTLNDLPDVLLNDTVSAVPAGTLIIIPSYCIHQLYHEAGVTYERYVLSINSEWIRSMLCERSKDYSYLYDSQEPVLLFPDKVQKKELIRHFNRLLSLPDHATPEAMISFLMLFDVIHKSVQDMQKNNALSDLNLPVSSTQQKVNQMIAYIQDHIHENITISDISEHFYMNPDYLARLFKSHMHITLGKYISLMKISAAEAMLREGKSVAAVQESLGFSSYAHFFKTFQKTTGISPSKYRKKY